MKHVEDSPEPKKLSLLERLLAWKILKFHGK